MLLNLFLFFLKIGSISFGGGYATIPMIQHQMSSHAWLTDAEFQKIIALASMAPGPVATNSATLIGYQIAGISGAIVATLGIILPSLFIIVLIATFFYKIQENQWVKASFYGLRPIVTALIAYAAIHLSMSGRSESFDWSAVASLLICAVSVYALIKYKINPIAVIAAAGLAGIVMF